MNQLDAQIKLVEMWKVLNLEDYPLKIEQQSTSNQGVSTRAASRGKPREIGMSTLTQNTCIEWMIEWMNDMFILFITCTIMIEKQFDDKALDRQRISLGVLVVAFLVRRRA